MNEASHSTPLLWIVLILATAGFVGIGAVAFIRGWQTNRRQEVASDPSDGTVSSHAPLRTYPSLPGEIRNIPRWITKDAPFDVEAAFAAVPADQNAAPLYLDALYEFLPNEMEPCVSPAERKARGPALKQRYLRAAQLQSQPPESVTRDERAEVVAEYQNSFDKLRRAQTRKLCVFEAVPGIDSGSAPHTAAARAVNRLLEWRTEVFVAEGQLDAAIDDVDLSLRLSRDLRPRGSLLSQMVAVAVEGTTLQSRVPQILNASGLTARHCDRLLESVAQHMSEEIDGLSEGMRYDYAYSRDVLHRLELKEDICAVLGAPGSTYGMVVQNSRKALGSEDEVATQIDEELARMTAADFAAEVKALNRLVQIFLGPTPGLDQAVSEMTVALGDSRILKYTLVGLERCVEAFCRKRIRLGGTRCLIALRRWRLEQDNANPPDLLTLCRSADMGAIPIDEYSGEPLRSVTNEGEFLIYSVGADGKDDQARIDWNMGRSAGDWIFRLSPGP